MIERFKEVDDNLLRGSAPSSKDLSVLRDVWGVERVVSLDGEIGEGISKDCQKLGLEHIILPLGDGRGKNVTELEEEIVPILNNKKTFIHCRHGKDRTGMACAMYEVYHGKKLGAALAEAFKMGMGAGLSESVKQSYYDAVKKFAAKQTDKNDADAVSITRDQLSHDTPIIGYQRTMSQGLADQQGNDHLNRPAFLNADNRFKKMAADTWVYRKCSDKELSQPGSFWYKNIEKAGRVGGGKIFKAKISNTANTRHIAKPYNKVLLQSALLSGSDIVVFLDGIVYVVRWDELENISEEVSDRNKLDVGLHDNYTGAANFVAPTGGGFLETNTGGFAGMVTLPGGGSL
jgi:hypothetical protein